MPHRVALVVIALSLTFAALPPSPAAASPPDYRPPVDAPVVDPFRAPTAPYGPGNRGLEYGTAFGTPVAAAADGVITFAGLVAGSRHVTVLHADGVRTTYSFLAQVDVVVGQRVAQGDRVGITAGRLHFGARKGDAYFDPAALFATAAGNDAWPLMSQLAASGFRDVTRLASSDPKMSADICATNRDAIVRWIDRFIEELTRLRGLVKEDGEALEQVFQQVRQARQRWMEQRYPSQGKPQ